MLFGNFFLLDGRLTKITTQREPKPLVWYRELTLKALQPTVRAYFITADDEWHHHPGS